MKLETLEQLIIDEQLGEMSTDVKELVTAYCKLHPAAAETEGDIKHLVSSIRTTLMDSSMEEIGPLPPPAFLDHLPIQRRSMWGSWSRGFAIAACLFLAFGLGRFWQPQAVETSRYAATSIDSSYASAPKTEQFWSLSRLRQNKPHESAATRQVLEWSSPLTAPTIGEKL